ncbi:MAG: SymE family type I addiction module toxin [Oribacterium sp.]|nr:SymE family type I addiction module toxin [Oribacterium sp.]
MQKNERDLKVYGMSGYHYKSTPTIMMKGQWLQEYGFEIGQQYHVQCEPGKIVITMPEEK